MSGLPRLTRKQAIGAIGAAIGFATVLLWFRFAPALFHPPLLAPDDHAGRLAFAARGLVLPGLTLLVGVWVAARRGFLPDAIDGTRFPASASLEINLRYNQNTVEQLLLAAIAWNAFALELPPDRLALIPAMAIAFAVGRATFWIGYLIHPMGRAFGMVVTILPTIAAYGWLGWTLLVD